MPQGALIYSNKRSIMLKEKRFQLLILSPPKRTWSIRLKEKHFQLLILGPPKRTWSIWLNKNAYSTIDLSAQEGV